MENFEKLLNELRYRVGEEVKLVPYEDEMREVLTLGSAYLIAASFLRRAYLLGKHEGRIEEEEVISPVTPKEASGALDGGGPA